jgi:hypothetical protein
VPLIRKPQTPVTGEGTLFLRRLEVVVRYVLASPPSQLRAGHNRIRGSIETLPDLAEEAFREGETALRLEDGSRFRLTMLGHTAGGATAYFEMRV